MLVFAYASVKFGMDIIVSVVVLTCLVKPIDYHMNGAIYNLYVLKAKYYSIELWGCDCRFE